MTDETPEQVRAQVKAEIDAERARGLACCAWCRSHYRHDLLAYGFCEHCGQWTYRDLWHGACGDCTWRWREYPDTMPPELRKFGQGDGRRGHDGGT